MEVKPGYKQTEVGVIPDDWQAASIRDFCSCYSGGTPSTTNSAYYGGHIPWITSSDLNKGRIEDVAGRITEEGLAKSAAKMVAPGTLLLALYGATAGVSAISTVQAAINQAILAIVPQDTDTEFLFQFFGLNKDRFIKTYTQGGQPNFSGEIVKSLKIPLPPLPEQRAIAAALSDVDALLGGLDRLIAKKRDLKQAAMQQLLTGQTRLPGFSGAWEVNTVAELEKQKLVKLSRGQVISKKDIDSTPGDCPIYSSSIHNNGLFGRYGDFMFDEELITWSVDGGGNFFHRPRHKFSVTNVCGFMRVETSRIDYRFFAAELQLLHSRKSFDYQSKAHPSVIRKEYEVHLPALAEQTAIAAVLSDMDAELAALEARRDKTRDLKQAMMQELLTGKTRLVKPEAAHA